MTKKKETKLDPAFLIAHEVVLERLKQRSKYSAKYDDEHDNEELAAAAASYATHVYYNSNLEYNPYEEFADDVPEIWHFDRSKWHPTTPRGDLIKAAALILAEIERMDRIEDE